MTIIHYVNYACTIHTCVVIHVCTGSGMKIHVVNRQKSPGKAKGFTNPIVSVELDPEALTKAVLAS